VPVSVALAGPQGSGKTTLFDALTRGRGADGVGMIDVPDPRLQRLADAVHPKKIVPAQIRVADAPPGSRAQRIAAAREADVVLLVLRCFGPDPDPAGDLESVTLDLVVTDLATVEKRIEAVAREVRGGHKEAIAEAETLERAKAHLDGGLPLRTLELEPERRAHLTGIFAASLKPAVVVANVDDSALPGGGEAAIAVAGELPVLVLSARLEAELGELEGAEAAELRESYGVGESSLDAVARAAWDAGGLITYFTAGEPEVRAWTVERDAPAPVAAGRIHSDFEKHFIRAEVTSVGELVEAGSMEALRAAGRLRVEGRDYLVQDGDVVFFRVGR
jgi:ribosome-binding ATPase YchF (GTP1/OBG family)